MVGNLWFVGDMGVRKRLLQLLHQQVAPLLESPVFPSSLQGMHEFLPGTSPGQSVGGGTLRSLGVQGGINGFICQGLACRFWGVRL